MNRKTLVLPAVAGLLAPVLVACGGSSGSGSHSAIVIGTTDRFEEAEGTPAPFDPAAAYDIASWNVIHSTFQTLLRLPRSGTDPVPDAATKCTFSDRKNEQYRCTLRSDLKFSSGRPVTVKDVKFSIDRVLGINFSNGPASLLANIDRVETPNDHEVVFQLKTPDATFPQKLATPAAAIVDSGAYAKDKLNKGFDAVGSGPYKLKTEEKDGRLTKAVLSRNTDYQGAVKTQNDKIELRFFDDSESMEKALKDGDIDVMNRSLDPGQIGPLSNASDKGVKLTDSPGQEIGYLVFNTDDPAVKPKAVRQAVAQLVDRQALTRDGYDRTADPLYSMVPSGITGHQTSFYNQYQDPSADKARTLLRSAGVSTPVKFTISYSSGHYGPAQAKAYQALAKQLNASGLFDVQLQDIKWSQYRSDAAKGMFQAYGMGWFPDFPDPDNFIAPFFGKDNFLHSPYRNAKLEALVPQSRQVAQRDAATKYFQQAQDMIADEVPVLPLWQSKQYIATRDNITGAEWALNACSELQMWELGGA
ncbi:ABC transporter substrate-binding protein [Streptomyces sp. NPDC052396]|uniref:ABC transporter substrate-binding protein n=1 Tax=Streptomyces sp. NPDC052396 TaxID=3365689 RepID=UPI0037D4BE94